MEQNQTKSKRGAPKGNLNAIKHGYYSRAFSRLEKTDLNRIDENLTSEINALRVIGRRIMTELKTSVLDHETAQAYINTMLKIASSIAKIYNIQSLIETRKTEFNESDPLEQLVKQIITERMKYPTEE
jgi:division protein CdvB (Snf7/Vps24/ESCRT-III family)